MSRFRVLFHGQFAKMHASDDGFMGMDRPYEGFYASRLLTAASRDAAIILGRELIREELDATVLRGRQGDLVALDAEEVEAVESPDVMVPDKGFTFLLMPCPGSEHHLHPRLLPRHLSYCPYRENFRSER